MNYKKALQILEIDLTYTNTNDITLEYLNKQYRKMALKNHPDKNDNTPESNETFKNINEAYHFLKSEISLYNEDDNIESDQSSLYYDILKGFMETFFLGKYDDLLSKIVNEIVNTSKKISIKLLDDLDKETAFRLYSFLSSNRTIFHLSQEILDNIRENVIKKYDNVEIYKLNPSINDLLNNNVYKLHINGELFLVPLWHNETYFDSSGTEIIVICHPGLPAGISLDDDNNILVDYEIDIIRELPEMLNNHKPIVIQLGDKKFDIKLLNLHIKSEQFYKIKNQGISKIKKDIYDISEKSDIIVKIRLK